MTLTAAAFDWVRAVVRTESAIVLDAGKEYLVESRLGPLARTAGHPDVSAYVDRARITADTGARDQIVDALTTNETSWFRDGGPYVVLEQEILPILREQRRASRSVRIWSAACSTGQEPYSIAMLMAETLISEGWRAEIMATDLSPTVLSQATAGRYSQIEINRGLQARRLVTHFSRTGMSFTINENLRRLITFRKMNLATRFPPMGQFDVVFLRNVLIYFSVETRREILKRVREVCRPDGFLILGAAETTLGVDDQWERVVMRSGAVYRPRP
jgi:chemotaxis protein methyltransferase CheR